MNFWAVPTGPIFYFSYTYKHNIWGSVHRLPDNLLLFDSYNKNTRLHLDNALTSTENQPSIGMSGSSFYHHTSIVEQFTLQIHIKTSYDNFKTLCEIWVSLIAVHYLFGFPLFGMT